MITNKNIQEILDLLNDNLKKKSIEREFTIFGSSALLAQNLTPPERTTYDIDILDPEIDTELQLSSIDVASKLGLDITWLNSAGFVFGLNFPDNWKERTVFVYKNTNLSVKSLGRSDLIASKVLSYCQRALSSDLFDLRSLNPTKKEITFIKNWIEKRPDFQKFEINFNSFLKEFNYE